MERKASLNMLVFVHWYLKIYLNVIQFEEIGQFSPIYQVISSINNIEVKLSITALFKLKSYKNEIDQH